MHDIVYMRLSKVKCANEESLATKQKRGRPGRGVCVNTDRQGVDESAR